MIFFLQEFSLIIENIFRNSERRVDVDKWYKRLVRAMFDVIPRIAVDNLKIPADVIKMGKHFLSNSDSIFYYFISRIPKPFSTWKIPIFTLDNQNLDTFLPINQNFDIKKPIFNQFWPEKLTFCPVFYFKNRNFDLLKPKNSNLNIQNQNLDTLLPKNQNFDVKKPKLNQFWLSKNQI